MSKKCFSRTALSITPALLASALLSTQQSVAAQNDIVVTANRMETPLSQTGSSITVITSDAIANSQKSSVVELLRTVPGLSVSQAGTHGVASVFMRGAESGHTKVLIDGITANDPADGNRAFNFAHLSLVNIDRIEILRGPQSTLYGSDAMGGVINIITKKGLRTTEANLNAEAGSFATFNQSANLAGGSDAINYSFGINHTKTDGISAATTQNGNGERDGSENTTLSTRVGIIINDQLDFDFIGRWQHATYDLDDYDNTTYAFMDDLNHTADDKQQMIRLAANLALFEDRWLQTWGASFTRNNRVDQDAGSDTAQITDIAFRDEFSSRTLKADWQNTLILNTTNTLITGIETGTEEASTLNHFGDLPKHRITTNSFYIQDSVQPIEQLNGTIGARIDDNEEFGSETTYRVTLSYQALDSTRLFGSYGTGFKAPTVFQLYAPTYGNSQLNAETSTGFDAGIEQNITRSAIITLTYFNNEFDDLISYDYVQSRYLNITQASTSGLETQAQYQPIEALTITIGYTYTDTENKQNHQRLLRRPQHQANLDLAFQYDERTFFNVDTRYIGQRDDYGYPSAIALDDYILVNLRMSHQLNPRVKVFGKLENLFDEDYEEIKGYGTQGTGAYVGATLSL
ncbi:MAG: TonB-dependent receptor [Hahellaceae bacterium]|nr:TonB-dependent receptor [Hahellaceae bacterium]